MAVFDASESLFLFDMVNLFAVDYLETLSATETEFKYFTNQSVLGTSHIRLNCSGITVDGDELPVTGNITDIEVQLGFVFGAFDPSIFISDLDVDLTDLVIDATSIEATNAFWSTVLAGDDEIIGNYSGVSGFGDFLFLNTGEVLTGGNDTITSHNSGTVGSAFNSISGDADQTNFASLTGGNDKITASITNQGQTLDGTLSVNGDVSFAFGGSVFGGDDTITASGGLTQNLLVGDIGLVDGGTETHGGADRIKGSNTFGDEISGDAHQAGAVVLMAGDDDLRGRGGDDTIWGDLAEGFGTELYAGNDTIEGGGGNDRLFGDVEHLEGGEVTKGGKDSLSGGKGDDLLDGGKGKDTLKGEKGSDTLKGGDGSDTLGGGDGGDRLKGGSKDDRLKGGSGRDTLEGGGGADEMTGGAGNDVFLFKKLSEIGLASGDRDVITDFAPGADQIDLSAIDAGSAEDDQSFVFIGTDGFSGTEGELRVNISGNRTVVQGDVDGDGTADFKLELSGTLNLTATDFVL